jgi:hypothetical protein
MSAVSYSKMFQPLKWFTDVKYIDSFLYCDLCLQSAMTIIQIIDMLQLAKYPGVVFNSYFVDV